MIYILVIFGVGYVLYRYIREINRSYKKLSIEQFYISDDNIPDDINLSNSENTTLRFDKGANKDDINLQSINKIKKEYAEICVNVNSTSDFKVNIFTDKNNILHKFSVTKLINTKNKKNAIYLSGNNDYFNNKKLGMKLFDAGYNLYAISFPNLGFTADVNDSNYSTFDNIDFLFQYIEVVLKYYKINSIDILFGHSTGGLIAIMYANYKNKIKNNFIKKMILSSPFLDYFSDPNAISYINSENFLKNIITPLGLIMPKINIKPTTGQPNFTTCVEFNECNFNPKYKSLIEVKTYFQWIRACTLAHNKIQNKKVDVKCNVIIFCSDKSVYGGYTENSDNILDVEDIQKYGKLISYNVDIKIVKDSIHNCFLRIDISDYTKL